MSTELTTNVIQSRLLWDSPNQIKRDLKNGIHQGIEKAKPLAEKSLKESVQMSTAVGGEVSKFAIKEYAARRLPLIMQPIAEGVVNSAIDSTMESTNEFSQTEIGPSVESTGNASEKGLFWLVDSTVDAASHVLSRLSAFFSRYI